MPNYVFTESSHQISPPTPDESGVVTAVLCKAHRRGGAPWSSLLVGGAAPDPATLDRMHQRLTLERFQKEVCASMIYLLMLNYVVCMRNAMNHPSA